jgi:Xaa-Pro aminopeptidase
MRAAARLSGAVRPHPPAAAAAAAVLALLLAPAPAPAREPAIPPPIGAEELAARRQKVAEAIGPDALLLLLPAEPAHRNGDVDWPFRQDDNLYYLTGISQEGTALALVPGEAEHREVLFARERDPLAEVWDGRLLDRDELTAASGIEEIAPSGRWRAFLEAALGGTAWGAGDLYRYYRPPGLPHLLAARRAGRAELWIDLGDRGAPGDPPTPELRLAEEVRARWPEVEIRDASPLLERMRAVKSPAELALLRRAVEITEEAIHAGMRRTLTAEHEYQVQATIEFTFRDLGACCWGYPSIVASGANATTLHYPSADAPIDRGGLMLFDVGADVRGYTADVSRTFPAGGTFTPEQRAIYEAVLTAWNETLPLFRAGNLPADAHRHALGVIARELAALGLVAAAEPEQAELYFMHGLGHPIGLQVHDVFDRARPWEPGMVATIEPGIYVRRADVEASEVFRGLTAEEQAAIRAVLDRYDGIGVRIEDDVLITDGEPVVLSDGLARTVEEIEAFLAEQTVGE